MAENVQQKLFSLSPAALRAAGIYLHRWLGLTVGLVFVAAGLSGTILAYAPELTNLMYPQTAGPPPPGWQAQRSTVLQRIQEEHPQGDITLLRFPNEKLGVYETWLQDDSQQYRDALNGDVVLVRDTFDLVGFSRELHVHLFMGHEGEEILGWVGVAMLVLVGTGLWLWWPRFGLWKFSFTRPRSKRFAPQLYWWHKTVGFVSLATLFFVTLTGVAMVFYIPAQKVLTTVFGGEAPVIPARLEEPAMASDWDAIIQRLDATLPQGRLVYFYPPESRDDVLLFRKKMPEEMHPNGRSFIALGPSGDVLHVNDATRLKAGMRATHAIYPLHSGKVENASWRFVVALMGVLPLFFFISGLWLWRMNRRRRAKVTDSTL